MKKKAKLSAALKRLEDLKVASKMKEEVEETEEGIQYGIFKGDGKPKGAMAAFGKKKKKEKKVKMEGLSNWKVNSVHVFQNAMIPIVTILAFSFAGLIGGAFITETILGIPGIGSFAVDSIFDRDYPVIMAITLIGSIAFVIANLIADISYAFIDPRIRLN